MRLLNIKHFHRFIKDNLQNGAVFTATEMEHDVFIESPVAALIPFYLAAYLMFKDAAVAAFNINSEIVWRIIIVKVFGLKSNAPDVVKRVGFNNGSGGFYCGSHRQIIARMEYKPIPPSGLIDAEPYINGKAS